MDSLGKGIRTDVRCTVQLGFYGRTSQDVRRPFFAFGLMDSNSINFAKRNVISFDEPLSAMIDRYLNHLLIASRYAILNQKEVEYYENLVDDIEKQIFCF